jgi:hypothetical protein
MSVKFRLLASLITAFFMAVGMSFVMVAVNVGFVPAFPLAWLKGWAIGYMVSVPLSYFLPPRIQKLLKKKGVR